ncbi:YeeE/YedE thiosulfate transporter family protein [uncultured Tenacibaculum sp.]|uniref:YeeE/YedE family protein n=1 Tax=uncultured Tenacibaculum sp. TaxID=174713 RepID=UPI00262C1241|nr:YeeE/YedE thiosulfate transporter family protein [uncultured Tenacibaculum sp.]
MEFILQSWPWYFSGFMIAFVMFLLLMLDKKLGMSSNLRTLCTICGAGKKVSFFSFDWKAQKWNLIVVFGVIVGGYIAYNFLSINTSVSINTETIQHLNALGFKNAGKSFLPEELFEISALSNFKSVLILVIGGFLVGFGARYAGGCTSGHAISGLSNLQFPSLIAVIGFFLGGLFMIHILFPLIF